MRAAVALPAMRCATCRTAALYSELHVGRSNAHPFLVMRATRQESGAQPTRLSLGLASGSGKLYPRGNTFLSLLAGHHPLGYDPWGRLILTKMGK